MTEVEKIIEDPTRVVHFVGVAGTGMSALAQYRVLRGGRATGSDRDFDRGELVATRACLEASGVRIVPQDGSGVDGADVVVASTAVESAIPDLARARDRGVATLHRAELLALHARGSSIAVAGSSGKSTVTAMLFHILLELGRDPSLITGGAVRSLRSATCLGNARAGNGPLVFEADESDGSLVRYWPETAVLLNLHRDHMELDRVLEQYRTLRAQTSGAFVVSDQPELRDLAQGAITFGFSSGVDVRGEILELERNRCRLRVGGARVTLPVPGRHNAWNALAAIATARALGVRNEDAGAALTSFAGVLRRFEIVGTRRGVEVVDDFAHNPEKILAVMTLAQSRARRVLVLFQPHGFAPTRFARNGIVDAFHRLLRPNDRLWLAPIYFAGGTVARDIASDDLVADLNGRGVPAALAPDRGTWVREIASVARDGDTVLILGARDPTLPALGRDVLGALS